MSQIHEPWDQGTIDAALVDVIGFAPPQKTIKTLCGRRVRKSRTIPGKATCPKCVAELRHLERLDRQVREIGRKMLRDLDAADRTERS